MAKPPPPFPLLPNDTEPSNTDQGPLPTVPVQLFQLRINNIDYTLIGPPIALAEDYDVQHLMIGGIISLEDFVKAAKIAEQQSKQPNYH